MTETQATSGTAEAFMNPVNPGGENPVALGKTADAQGVPTGRAAVGRATVPSDNSPTSSPPVAQSSAPPRFTRAAGMAPPPDEPTQPVFVHGSDMTGAQSPSPVTPDVTAARSSTGSHPTVGAAVAHATVRPNATPAALGPIQVGAARVANAVRGVRAAVAAGPGRGPRRARLYIKRIDPWSVMKFSFAVSFVLLVVAVVATSVLYLALDAMGVFDSVNQALAAMFTSNGAKSGFKITAKGVIFGSALLGTVNVVLFTALATLGAFIYNVCADMVGGIELTLAEKE